MAAVLLFVCGERAAYRLLTHLVGCHLRDCTRVDLAAATEVLRLLYPILQQVSVCGGGAEQRQPGGGSGWAGTHRGGLAPAWCPHGVPRRPERQARHEWVAQLGRR